MSHWKQLHELPFTPLNAGSLHRTSNDEIVALGRDSSRNNIRSVYLYSAARGWESKLDIEDSIAAGPTFRGDRLFYVTNNVSNYDSIKALVRLDWKERRMTTMMFPGSTRYRPHKLLAVDDDIHMVTRNDCAALSAVMDLVAGRLDPHTVVNVNDDSFRSGGVLPSRTGLSENFTPEILIHCQSRNSIIAFSRLHNRVAEYGLSDDQKQWKMKVPNLKGLVQRRRGSAVKTIDEQYVVIFGTEMEVPKIWIYEMESNEFRESKVQVPVNMTGTSESNYLDHYHAVILIGSGNERAMLLAFGYVRRLQSQFPTVQPLPFVLKQLIGSYGNDEELHLMKHSTSFHWKIPLSYVLEKEEDVTKLDASTVKAAELAMEAMSQKQKDCNAPQGTAKHPLAVMEYIAVAVSSGISSTKTVTISNVTKKGVNLIRRHHAKGLLEINDIQPIDGLFSVTLRFNDGFAGKLKYWKSGYFLSTRLPAQIEELQKHAIADGTGYILRFEFNKNSKDNQWEVYDHAIDNEREWQKISHCTWFVSEDFPKISGKMNNAEMQRFNEFKVPKRHNRNSDRCGYSGGYGHRGGSSYGRRNGRGGYSGRSWGADGDREDRDRMSNNNSNGNRRREWDHRNDDRREHYQNRNRNRNRNRNGNKDRKRRRDQGYNHSNKRGRK